MRNIERRPRTVGDIGIRVVILSLAALVLMALQLTGQLRPLQSAIALFTSPAQVSATAVTQNVTNVVSFFVELRNLRQRNAELEQFNSSLLAQNFTLREMERENESLRALLDFAQKRPGLELRGAQIVGLAISQESTNFLDSIRIDLGLTHGVKVGMTVLTDQGLVGRITEVTSNSQSKVLLLTDPTSAVQVVLQESRLDGVVRGSAGGNLLMDFIPNNREFKVGEAVLTSGIGSSFPRGIPIGQVVEIIQRDIDFSQQAVIRPTVDFRRLELVAVVTNFDPAEEVEALAPIPTPNAAGTITGTNGISGTTGISGTFGITATNGVDANPPLTGPIPGPGEGAP